MNKRLSLFPMSRDMCAVARYAALLHGYELAHLLVPGYLRMGGDDASRLDGGTHVGLPLTDYSKDILLECDVIYMDYDETMTSNDLYKEIVTHAKEMGVEVMPSRALRQKLNIIFDNPLAVDDAHHTAAPEKKFLNEINIPVVTVLSHGLFTDQLAVELALRQHFIDAGYRVGQIGSHNVCKLLGFTEMPDFMMEPADAYEKIIRFNKYVSDMVAKDKNEILIIGAPDAIMKYNDRLLQGHGILPYVVCSAVRSDVAIACTYYGDYKKGFFDEVSQYCKYHQGSPIHFFNVANTSAAPDQSVVQDAIRLIYTNLDSSFVLNAINNITAGEYHLFNVLDRDSAKEACLAVQRILSGNASFMR